MLKPDPIFKDDKLVEQFKEDEIEIKPWIETNQKRHETSIGISIGMSFETLGKLIDKLKFWKR